MLGFGGTLTAQRREIAFCQRIVVNSDSTRHIKAIELL